MFLVLAYESHQRQLDLACRIRPKIPSMVHHVVTQRSSNANGPSIDFITVMQHKPLPERLATLQHNGQDGIEGATKKNILATFCSVARLLEIKQPQGLKRYEQNYSVCGLPAVDACGRLSIVLIGLRHKGHRLGLSCEAHTPQSAMWPQGRRHVEIALS